MLITDKIIYLELEKTATSYVQAVLTEMYPDTHVTIGKHGLYQSMPQFFLQNAEKKWKVGNIRNPWDWYVSLWAQGCQSKNRGGFRGNLIKDRHSFKYKTSLRGVRSKGKQLLGKSYPWRHRNIWGPLYSDVGNIENFNTWLKLILSSEKFEVDPGYKIKQLSGFAGLLTYKYLEMYTTGNGLHKVGSFDHLRAYDQHQNFMYEILKSETLIEQLTVLAESLQYDMVIFKEIISNYRERSNRSSRLKDYREYYTEESMQMVEQYEKFIIEKYQYSFS